MAQLLYRSMSLVEDACRDRCRVAVADPHLLPLRKESLESEQSALRAPLRRARARRARPSGDA